MFSIYEVHAVFLVLAWSIVSETGREVEREKESKGKKGGGYSVAFFHTQTDRHTHRQTDRQTDKQTDRHTHFGCRCWFW